MDTMQYTHLYRSPLGTITLAADSEGLTGLWFEGEEPYLPLDAARIARQAAVAPHDPMAGNDDADGIVSDSAAYGLCRDGFRALPAGDFTGDLSVGDRLPEGDLPQNFPHGQPER